jgi:hypothetical protein
MLDYVHLSETGEFRSKDGARITFYNGEAE